MLTQSRQSALLIVCLSFFTHSLPVKAQTSPTTLRQWGETTLQDINRVFWIPQRNLYADEAEVGKPVLNKPAFMWGCGVQLPALVAATRLDRNTYAPQLRRYTEALDVYWMQHKGLVGYDVLPVPKPPDRYYDDNAWMVLAFAEAYELTYDPAYLKRAERAYRFVMSGEDNKLGGGIYWKENEKVSKNTCSNAPSASAALELYQLTRQGSYLGDAHRIYNWTCNNLQDKDALFFDNINLEGKIEKTKWSYNTALMLRTNCQFYEITRDRKYLAEAQRIAEAAEAHWVRPEDGAIKDDGQFAHLLSEAFLYLYEQDGNRHWLNVVNRALTTLHDKMRDANGHYAKRWERPMSTPLTTLRLIDQASAARAYLVAARYK